MQLTTPPADQLHPRFFITLEPCAHLNGKHTIFGRLVSGEDALARIAQVPVDKNDRPLKPVLVSRCGELERKKKQRDSKRENAIPEKSSDDRGRRRKSDQDHSSDEMDASPPPERQRRKRRQSDNVVDEGIRGRPRLRSLSHSPSNPIIEEDDDISPAEMHKRKRSPSPSRHTDRRDENATYERRRRSLPNQYNDREARRDGDEDRYRPSPRREDHGYAGRRRENDRDDRYRPRNRFQEEGRLDNSGRLGGSGSGDHAPVKFKGRGAMKY